MRQSDKVTKIDKKNRRGIFRGGKYIKEQRKLNMVGVFKNTQTSTKRKNSGFESKK